MAQSPIYDGPRLIRAGEESSSRRLAEACFGNFASMHELEAAGDLARERPARRKVRDDEELHVIAQGDTLVSQIFIVRTPLRVYDGVIRVGSIGGVGTLPEHRGQGLASRLLEHCARRLVEKGASLMLISGGRGLYLRAGCVPSGRHAEFVVNAGRSPDVSPGLPLDIHLRAARPADALVCSRLYQAEPVHFTRTPGKFAEYLGQGDGYHAEDWIIERGGQPAAYLLLNTPWEYLNDPDAGMRMLCEYAGSRTALVEALPGLFAPGQGGRLLREIHFAAPWQDADLIHLLEQRYGSPAATSLPDHTARILNFPALMAGLDGYVRARIDPRLRRGLRFEQTGSLLSGTGEANHCAITRGRDRLELDTAAMTALVTGSPEASFTPRLPGALAEIFPALFPLPAFLPGLDYH